jgi:hypothetical protein
MCCDKGETQGVTDHPLTCRTTILSDCSFSDIREHRRRPAAWTRLRAACLVARGVHNNLVAHHGQPVGWQASAADSISSTTSFGWETIGR